MMNRYSFRKIAPGSPVRPPVRRLPLSFALVVTLACGICLGGAVVAQAQGEDSELVPDFAVVVHQDNTTGPMEANKVARIFLGRTSRWQDWEGEPTVVPLDQVKESPVRAVFSREIHGKEVDKIVKWWYRQIYSGRGKAPDELAGDVEVLEAVAANPGAVGYVARSSLPADGVRELTVTP